MLMKTQHSIHIDYFSAKVLNENPTIQTTSHLFEPDLLIVLSSRLFQLELEEVEEYCTVDKNNKHNIAKRYRATPCNVHIYIENFS